MNKARLEYEMSIRGVTRAKLCEVLGISRSAFYRKCNGGSEFTQGEIQKMVDYLKLDTPVGIFLMLECPKRHNGIRKDCEVRTWKNFLPHTN